MNSAAELYLEAPKFGLKPVLGCELYLQSPYMDQIRDAYIRAWKSSDPRFKTRIKNQLAPENEAKILADIEKRAREYYFHLTVHFKDFEAYKYFCSISPAMNSRSVSRFGEVKPVATLEEVSKIKKNIVICSSCMVGPIGKTLLGSRDGIIAPNPVAAEQYYLMLRELVGQDNFFVEVFPHEVTHEWVKAQYNEDGSKKENTGFFKPNECSPNWPDGDVLKYVNNFILSLARKYNDKVIVSLDSHFANPEQKTTQDARLLNGSEEGWKFHQSYHILTSEEAYQILNKKVGVERAEFAQWIENSYEWGSKFDNFKMPTAKDRWLLPDVTAGWQQQLKTKIDRYGRMDWTNQEMKDRLQQEIKVLTQNGKINLISYFLIVEDISNFCHENGVLMNVRGSAGGSLLLYLLGVSAVNPLKHNLSFERFLTNGRVLSGSLPDADLDVSDQEKVFSYLTQKYGDNFCRISIDLLLRIKSAIKDAERLTYGYVRPTTEDLTKGLPVTPQGVDDHDFVFGYTDDNDVHHQGLFDQNEKLRKYAEDNADIWAIVKEMLSIQRGKSVHACGLVIAPEPVQNFLPVIKVGDTKVTGFNPKMVEAMGGVKFDVLGLNTLRDIQSCLKSINDRLGIKLDWANLPNCEKSWSNFAVAKTETVFQFDTATVRPLLIDIKPKNLDQLSNTTALGRPGTLDALAQDGRTLADVFLACAANRELPEYIHPDLEPILGGTYGIQLFQEQTLRIFRDIAGMTYEEAETVRRAIGKKDEKTLLDCTLRLKKSCLEKGWTSEQAEVLMAQIMASSRYSFNQSHSTSYAYVAYACMYLKTNYPLDWWKAILSNAKKDEIAPKFWRYVAEFTDLPDINNSSDEFVIKDDRLIAPFSIINGLGEKTYQHITKHAPYTDFNHFATIAMTKGDNGRAPVTEEVVRKMIVSGLLDTLFPAHLSLLSEKLDLFQEIIAQTKGKKKEPVPEKYIGIGDLGRYIIKKQLVPQYSKDLRPLLLLNRGGSSKEITNGTVWQWHWAHEDYRNNGGTSEININVIAGDKLEILKAMTDMGQVQEGYTVGMLAYVLDEKQKDYANKSKTATNVSLDVGGYFYDEMIWPAYGESKAITGFKGTIAMMIYQVGQQRDKTNGFIKSVLRLKKVVPIVTKAQLGDLNMV